MCLQSNWETDRLKIMLINLPSSAKTSLSRPRSSSKPGSPTTHEQIVKRDRKRVNIFEAVLARWPGKMY